jgi:hypothetical protein
MRPDKKLAQYGDDGELRSEKFCTDCGSINSASAESCINCNTSFSTKSLQQADQTSSDSWRSEFSWFPYREYSILIPGSVEDAASRLAQATIKRRWFYGWRWWFSSPGSFEGTVSVDEFILYRVINYTNWFWPYLHGSFKRVRSRTRVTVKMKLNPHVSLMMIGWSASALLSSVGLLFDRSYGFIVPAGLYLFIYLLMLIGFNFEAHKAKIFLEGVFRPHKNS